ncbi:MAG: hypothetical protein WCI67_17400 [Chloroflexales bacterium]
MTRRRSVAASGVRPPQISGALPPAPAPIILVDQTSYHEVALTDADLSGTRAEDVALDQVVCRRVRLAQAELARLQLTDVQLDT